MVPKGKQINKTRQHISRLGDNSQGACLTDTYRCKPTRFARGNCFEFFLTLFRTFFNVRQYVWYWQVYLCKALCILLMFCELWISLFVCIVIVSTNQTGGCICCSGQPQWRKRCSLLWHCQCQVQGRLQLHRHLTTYLSHRYIVCECIS